jgi:hypothetical protein
MHLDIKGERQMKFLIETGTESHTSSWQKCQARFIGGAKDGQYLYQDKPSIISTEWPVNDKHARVAKTVYDLPEGTEILIDYQGHEGPEKFIVCLDASQEVQEREIGTSRLRTYTMKGRFTLVRDLIEAAKTNLKTSQEEGF